MMIMSARYEITVSSQGETFREETVLLKRLEEVFPGEAWIYAVLDDGVVLGVWNRNRAVVGRTAGQNTRTVEFTGLQWDCVRELRVFDSNKEFRAHRMEGGYAGRLLNDENSQDEKRLWAVDETQKLWGQVAWTQTGADEKVWCLLSSGRGTRIVVPFEASEAPGKSEYAGIRVRRYMRFPSADEHKGLICFEDERLCGFCRWGKMEGGKGDGI